MENKSHDVIHEKKKRYLKRYRVINAKIERLEERLYELDMRLTNPPSVRYSDEPKASSVKTREDLILDKLELQDRIDRFVEKSKTIRAEIVGYIDTLDDPTEAEILESFFIDGKPLEEIAEGLGYTVRHVVRLYGVGISKLDIELDSVTKHAENVSKMSLA